jgi:hypothetical protein
MGFGHGGRTAAHPAADFGDVIVYPNTTFGWDNGNLKPNYRSVMNYGYNGAVCFDTRSGTMVAAETYSAEQFPALDETRLDERATGEFASALRASSCSNVSAEVGLVPAIVHSCSS